MNCKELSNRAIDILEGMIPIPALSFHEKERSKYLWERISAFIKEGKQSKDCPTAQAFKAITVRKVNDNILLYSPKKGRKLLLMCAHVDTVQPADNYTVNPYSATRRGGRILGLGTNDDGASVACMLVTFLSLVAEEERCGLLLVLSTQEERGGKDGLYSAMEYLKTQNIKPDFALVGEPTGMKAAIAERGLLVIDATACGTSAHAAHPNKDNAIYNALKDIEKLRRFTFRKKSEFFGPVLLSVTRIEAGKSHNTIPDKCSFVIDIRPNERYTPEEIAARLSAKTDSTLKPRNLNHKCRVTPQGHPLVKAVKSLGIETFISSTSSDWTWLDIPAIKIGPGDSSRSHKADEYITLKEIEDGIKGYKAIIGKISATCNKPK